MRSNLLNISESPSAREQAGKTWAYGGGGHFLFEPHFTERTLPPDSQGWEPIKAGQRWEDVLWNINQHTRDSYYYFFIFVSSTEECTAWWELEGWFGGQKLLLLFQRTRVGSPAPTLRGLQPPVTLAPEEPMPCSGFHGHCIHAHATNLPTHK